MTIQTITVRPTKFDLSAHDIRLANIFPIDSSDQMLRADC